MVIARSVEMVKDSNVGISGVEEMSGVHNVKHEFTESKIMTAHFHLPGIHFVGPSQSVVVFEASRLVEIIAR